MKNSMHGPDRHEGKDQTQVSSDMAGGEKLRVDDAQHQEVSWLWSVTSEVRNDIMSNSAR